MRNEYENAPVLTEEKFNEFAACDETLNGMRYPRVLTKKNGWPWDKTLTFTYPVEYEMTEDQVEKAKELAQKRHDEQIAMLTPGMLAWKGMGCDYKMGDGYIENHRVRCRFVNDEGRTFSMEIHPSPNSFWIDYVIDCDLMAKREEEGRVYFDTYHAQKKAYAESHAKAMLIEDKSERMKAIYAIERPVWNWSDPQDYYLREWDHKSVDCKSTFDAVRQWVNDNFCCSFDRSALFEYFIDCDECFSRSK